MPDQTLIRVANVGLVDRIVENVSVWDGVKQVAPLPGCERVPLYPWESAVFRGWTYDASRTPRFEPPQEVQE